MLEKTKTKKNTYIASLHTKKEPIYLIYIRLTEFIHKENLEYLMELSTKISPNGTPLLFRNHDLHSRIQLGDFIFKYIEEIHQNNTLLPNTVLKKQDKRPCTLKHNFVENANTLRIYLCTKRLAHIIMQSPFRFVDKKLKLHLNKKQVRYVA